MKRTIFTLAALLCFNSAAFAAIDWESKGMQIAGEIFTQIGRDALFSNESIGNSAIKI